MRISDWSSDGCSSDLPPALLREVRLSNSLSRPAAARPSHGAIFACAAVPDTPFALGQRVRHPLFGEGTIDRKSVVSGKSVSVRVDLGGSRSIKQTTNKLMTTSMITNICNT